MAVHIKKKPTTSAPVQGGEIGTVTPPPKEDKEGGIHQPATDSADAWNAPEDTFLSGNGVTSPERMSAQCKVLCRTEPGYLALYLDMQAKLASGATANSFKTSSNTHLKPLAEWFNKRKDRVKETAHLGEPSPELMVWPGIAWHMGPNPAPGELSIDRIDPTQPYRLMNLRWADKATQAANQRRNRKNLWQNTAITDRQLAAELAGLKIGTNAHAIKAMRHRIKSAHTDGKPIFPTPEAIHTELLRRLKVPAYVPKSGDPIRDEPLMNGLGRDWEEEKKAKPWLTNIGFQLEWVESKEKEIRGELAYWNKVYSKNQVTIDQLELRLSAVLDFQRKLKNRLQTLHEKKSEKLNSEINPHATDEPPTVEGFQHYHPQITAKEENAMFTQPAPPKPEPLAIATAEDVDALMTQLGIVTPNLFKYRNRVITTVEEYQAWANDPDAFEPGAARPKFSGAAHDYHLKNLE
jgi:hypothetical protein